MVIAATLIILFLPSQTMLFTIPFVGPPLSMSEDNYKIIRAGILWVCIVFIATLFRPDSMPKTVKLSKNLLKKIQNPPTTQRILNEHENEEETRQVPIPPGIDPIRSQVYPGYAAGPARYGEARHLTIA